MGKIIVFDSGFGSLSIIKSIQKHTKAHIIYFADQKNYPYGKKSRNELKKIINNTINNLHKLFSPDLIVIGSNTPSLLVNEILSESTGVMGVLPPIHQAHQLTKTNSIAMLVTNSVAKSSRLKQFIENNSTKNIKTTIINASELIDLVESGKFLHNKKFCFDKIRSVLGVKFERNDIDVATLSSTHLHFLLSYLQNIFPNITFIDPADTVAQNIITNKLFLPSKRNSLKIFSSGKNIQHFEKDLHLLGIREKIQTLRF